MISPVMCFSNTSCLHCPTRCALSTPINLLNRLKTINPDRDRENRFKMDGYTVSFEIENLKEADVEESAKVLLQSLGSQFSPVFQDSRALSRAIYGPHAITLVAKKKGRIVGVINGTATAQPTIVFLGVMDPDSAREGLGLILVDNFLEHVKKQFPKATAVRTTLPADFPEAVALYSSKGFMVEGFAKEAAQGRDIVFLKKSLTRSMTPVT